MYLVGGVSRVHRHATNAIYIIKGELGPDFSAVWIEDEKTGAQVGNKLRIKGAAKAGFFGVKGTVEQIPPPVTATP